MFKVIKLNNSKYGIKEIDENGNSVGMKEQSFETESEALLFLKGDEVESPKKEKETTMEDEEKEEGEETDEEETEEGDDADSDESDSDEAK